MCDSPDPCQPVLSPSPASAEGLADRSLEDAWTFLEKSDTTIGRNFDTTSSITCTPRITTQSQSQLRTTPTGFDGQSLNATDDNGDGGDDGAEDYPDLAPFVRVSRRERHFGDAAEYDAFIDVPLPRCHSEVVRTNAAKSAAGRRRAALFSSKVRARDFTGIRELYNLGVRPC